MDPDVICSDKRFGAMYPQFTICREYLREKIVLERKTQKRMSAASLGSGKKQQRQHKQHSMDILLEAVNKVIWGIFEDMEAFEYQYDESIQVDEPSFITPTPTTATSTTSTTGMTLDESWLLRSVTIRPFKLRRSSKAGHLAGFFGSREAAERQNGCC